jgi:hypothetical protein
MSETLTKLRKRRCSSVTVNGDEYFVGSLTKAEIRRYEALPGEDKTGFVMGCVLRVDAGGEREFPQEPDESDQQWAHRVGGLLEDVPTETIREISEAVSKLGTVPKAADVVKN